MKKKEIIAKQDELIQHFKAHYIAKKGTPVVNIHTHTVLHVKNTTNKLIFELSALKAEQGEQTTESGKTYHKVPFELSVETWDKLTLDERLKFKGLLFEKISIQSRLTAEEIPSDTVTKMQKEFEPNPDTSFKQGMYSGYAFGLQDGFKLARAQFEGDKLREELNEDERKKILIGYSNWLWLHNNGESTTDSIDTYIKYLKNR